MKDCFRPARVVARYVRSILRELADDHQAKMFDAPLTTQYFYFSDNSEGNDR